MTYPTITHLDDVLPSIAGRSEFVHAQRDGYSVIDYNFALADSFDDPIRLECRGIKFGPGGEIIARPLHKFFNIGERNDTQPHVLDFSQLHVITEKLDGSMIHAALVNDEVVFMTRMGRTDVARKAERHLTAEMAIKIDRVIRYGWTPIFEFTAPDNRIVVKYGSSGLTLLAMRATREGHYLDDEQLQWASVDLGVPAVPLHVSDWNSGQAFLDYARAVRGLEGFVVRFASGLWVKAKGDDYVLKHRAKDSILQEKNVLALILCGGLDDVLPLLDDNDRKRIEQYQAAVSIGIVKTADHLRKHVESGSSLDQKTFAVQHQQKIAPDLRPLAFVIRQGNGAAEAVRGALMKATGSQSNVDASRHLHGAAW